MDRKAIEALTGCTPAALANAVLVRRAERVETAPAAELEAVTAIVSTSAPVRRAFGQEVLAHGPDSIDLSRAVDGKLPLLAIHDQRRWPIGYATDFKLDGEQLRASLHFANTPDGQEPLALHRQGVPLGVSVGYEVDWETAEHDEDTDTVRFARWMPHEVSIAPVQADAAAILGRNKGGESTMPATIDKSDGGTAGTGGQVLDFDAAFRSGRDKGAAEGQALERARLAQIRAIFGLSSVPDTARMRALRDTAEEKGWSEDRTRAEVLARLGEESADESGTPAPAARGAAGQPDGHVMAGTDQRDKFGSAMQSVLLHRSGVERTDESAAVMRESGLGGLRLLDMAREYLRMSDHPEHRHPDPERLVGRAFTVRAGGHTTSDFTNILSNVANKSMLVGWEEQPETWRAIARTGSLPDFKQGERPGLSHFSDLDTVPEDGEPSSGTLSDFKETIQLVEYGRVLRLGRRTIINDDLGAFTRAPRLMGRAAARKIGDVLYNALISNSSTGPTLNQDSTVLFHADHSNIGTSGAISVTTLDDGFTKMGTQTDPLGVSVLAIRPRTLLVPLAKEATALSIVMAEKDPSVASGESPNPFRNRLEVVAESRLDANSATRWYLFADPNMFDTWEVAFLNGIEEPYMREEEEWSTRGVKFAVGIDAGVAALDYRAQLTNAGT